jgi:hypothetical protein
MRKELIDVVRELKRLNNVAEDFVEEVPYCIASSIFDNDYANAKGLSVELLIRALFQDDTEEIFWFLYEFKPKPTPQLWLADGTAIAFTCEEDYYKYLETI